jgi:hypothetical protein
MNSRRGVTATASGSQISDFRFQIEGCLIANWLFEQNENVPLTYSVCFVLRCLVQSQIRNLQ